MNKMLIVKRESGITDSEVKERAHARAHTRTEYSDSINIISLFKLPEIHVGKMRTFVLRLGVELRVEILLYIQHSSHSNNVKCTRVMRQPQYSTNPQRAIKYNCYCVYICRNSEGDQKSEFQFMTPLLHPNSHQATRETCSERYGD